MKKYVLLLGFLFLIPLVNAFILGNVPISSDFKTSGNYTTGYLLNGSTSPIYYNVSNTLVTRMYYFDDLTDYGIKNGISVVRVRVSCPTKISDYNSINPSTSINKIVIDIIHHNNYNRNNLGYYYVSERDTITLLENTSSNIYNFLYFMDTHDTVAINKLTYYNSLPDYDEHICDISWYVPSEKDDSVDFSGQTIKEVENEAIENIQDYNNNIWKYINDLINIIYQVMLIIYWIVKILVLIAVISSIFWLAFWFYTLIKKLLARF